MERFLAGQRVLQMSQISKSCVWVIKCFEGPAQCVAIGQRVLLTELNYERDLEI